MAKFGLYLNEKWTLHRKMKSGTYTELVGDVETKDAQQMTGTVVDNIKKILKQRGYSPKFIKVEIERL